MHTDSAPNPICACGELIERLWDHTIGGYSIPKECFACRAIETRCQTCDGRLDSGDVHDNGDGEPDFFRQCAICRRFNGVIYVNAYSVTRHRGGGEEGGWYYNVGTPIASVPVLATVILREAVPTSPAQVEADRRRLEAIFADRKVGDIYSVRGGVDIEVCVEDHIAVAFPEVRPHYE